MLLSIGSKFCRCQVFLGHNRIAGGVKSISTGRGDSGTSAAEQMAEEIEKDLKGIKKRSLSSIDEHRRPMTSLVKEMFCGRFNKIVLTYPDIVDNDRYFDLEERCKQAMKALREREDLLEKIAVEKRIPKDLILALRSQGFFGLNVPVEEGGEGLSISETCKLLEELSVNMSLSETIGAATTSGTFAIRKYATEEFKKKHLKSLVEGTAIGAWCVAEEKSGSDVTSLNTKAIPNEDNSGEFIINGRKMWVLNAEIADFFTVIAKDTMRDDAGVPSEEITAYVIPKDAKGVTVLSQERHDFAGLKGVSCCPVDFNNVIVKSENVLGERSHADIIYNEMLTETRLFSSSRILGALRYMINTACRRVLSRKSFGKRLVEFDLVNKRLAQAMVRLYALESMVYMTTGIADYQEEMDIAMEAACCKRFAIQAIEEISENCKALFGTESFLEDFELRKIAEDLNGYKLWETTDDMLSMYIGVGGCSTAGMELETQIRKLRYPLMHPFATFKFAADNLSLSGRVPRLSLDLSGCVHPSLGKEADILEANVIRFGHIVKLLFKRSGSNVGLMEIDLKNLGDIVTELYGMSCVLARASRSYCDGHDHMISELKLARAFVLSSEDPVMEKMQQVVAEPDKNVDLLYKMIGDEVKAYGKYPTVHPTTKNIF